MSAAPTESAMASPPAPAVTPEGVPANYRVPSLGWRIFAGGLRFVGVLVVLTALPAGLITFLSAQGIHPPIPLATVEVFGVLIAVLTALRYILKPTAAYGPLAIALAGAGLAYLYLLFVTASYAIAIPHTGATISIDYARLILVLMIGPALAATAGFLTLIEDLGHPKERLPYDYPA